MTGSAPWPEAAAHRMTTPSTRLPDDSGLAPLARAATAVAAFALVCLVVVEGWQVVARYVLNDSPGWTEPMALLCLNVAMMFGAAVGVRNDAHFGFFIAVQAAPAGLQRLLRAIACAVAGAIGAVLSWWGGTLMLDAWDVPMAGASLPQGIAYAPMCLGGALILLFALERLLALYRRAAPGSA